MGISGIESGGLSEESRKSEKVEKLDLASGEISENTAKCQG